MDTCGYEICLLVGGIASPEPDELSPRGIEGGGLHGFAGLSPTADQNSYVAPGPGATVHQITHQDGCPADMTEHANLPYDERVNHFVEQALDPDHDLGPAPCRPVALIPSK